MWHLISHGATVLVSIVFNFNVFNQFYKTTSGLQSYVWCCVIAYYRGEDAVVDRIESRIEEVGLRHRHARDLQLLSYEEGVAYNDHTDCFYKNKVTDHDKAATFLSYLQDGEMTIIYVHL